LLQATTVTHDVRFKLAQPIIFEIHTCYVRAREEVGERWPVVAIAHGRWRRGDV
jgi:hypothetical protein